MIGAIYGLLQPLALPVLDFFKDWRDQRHELALMQKQMERERQLADIRLAEADKRLEEAIIAGDAAEMVERQKQDQIMTGTWIDALRASVRPVFSYVVLMAWVLVKIARFVMLQDLGDGFFEAAIKMWGPEDTEILWYIITYYFGERTSAKWMQRQ